MLNAIWVSMIVLSLVSAVITGKVDALVLAVNQEAKFAFEVALSLAGIMAFWLGLMRIAQEAGLLAVLSKLIRPIMIRLFPEVPVEHPAMGNMVLNIAANMLGLSNAATPFGIKAMESLEQLNPYPGVATDAMCTFLAINTSSVQLLPATAMSYLVAGGAGAPADIIVTSFLATICSTIAALVSVTLFKAMPRFAVKKGAST
jgi:spore maturation protein A